MASSSSGGKSSTWEQQAHNAMLDLNITKHPLSYEASSSNCRSRQLVDEFDSFYLTSESSLFNSNSKAQDEFRKYALDVSTACRRNADSCFVTSMSFHTPREEASRLGETLSDGAEVVNYLSEGTYTDDVYGFSRLRAGRSTTPSSHNALEQSEQKCRANL
jgi:hypothetical protein